MSTLRRFVAIDGESFTSETSHDYVLLASSVDGYAYNPAGLSTVECFRYLADLKRRTPNSIYVAFGLNYDVNMMLRDLGRDSLKHLWTHRKLRWRNYRIEWIPGKWFSVGAKGEKAIRVYDVFGFFQSSFLRALEDWGIEAPKTMAGMKESRHSFNPAMLPQIVEYCQDECAKLVELMDALKSALSDTGLIPRSWVGAGAIASTLMRREGIKAIHAYDSEHPPYVREALLRGYFGGRVELFQSGPFDRLTSYDVCSAYPAETLSLPPLAGGSWEPSCDPTAAHSLSLVEWNVPVDQRVMPFPFRHKGGIYYPSRGSGWYHYPEVRAALKAYERYIHVRETYQFRPETIGTPFDFVRRLYLERARMKADGHAGQKVLKLGLNSLYGKLAQGVGYGDSAPPFQSFHWAGRITSGTRARLFDLAREAPDDVVMIATDGIFYRDPAPDFPTGKALGDLERSVFTDCFIAQPGVYQATTEDGKTISKSRGFFAREIDWEDIRDGFARSGVHHVSHYSSRRFLGLGGALSRRDLSDWRTWTEGSRALSLYPSRKFVPQDSLDGEPVYHTPGEFSEKVLSDMYHPKDSDLTWLLDAREHVDGMEQPLMEG